MALSEAEIRELELLEQGIYPVREYEFDKVLRLIDNVADFLEKAFGPDKKLSKDDFTKFQGTWDCLFECRDYWDDIQAEFPKLGIIGKVTLLVKGFGALKKLFAAVKSISK